jgi:hypothetical protein
MGWKPSHIRGGRRLGWHLATTLTLPANISLMPLPAKSPEQARWTLLADKMRRLVPPACDREECGKLPLLDTATRATFLGSQLVPLCPNCG